MSEKLTKKKIIELVGTVLAVIIMIPLMIILYGFFFLVFILMSIVIIVLFPIVAILNLLGIKINFAEEKKKS